MPPRIRKRLGRRAWWRFFRIVSHDHFLRRALGIAFPVALGYFVVVLALLAEAMFVGREEGHDGLAAMGLATPFVLTLVLAFHAVEIGVQAIVARRMGERQPTAAGVVLDNGIVLSLGLGSLIAIGLLFLGPSIFSNPKPEVTELAFAYFRYRIPGIPFLIAALAVMGFFNGTGKAHLGTTVAACMLVGNVLLDYILIPGHFGVPALGIRGAGMASSLSVVMGFGVFLLILSTRKFRLTFHCLRLKRNLRVEPMTALLRIASPVFLQQILSNAGMFVFAKINGAVADGGVSLAAATVCFNTGLLTYLPGLGFGIAAATLVGHHMGARQFHRAAITTVVCWAVCALYMCSCGCLFVAFGGWFARIFLPPSMRVGQHAQDVVVLASQVFWIVGAYQVFDALQAVFSKALQSAGKMRFVTIASLSTHWLLFLPLAWLLAHTFGFGIKGSFTAYTIYLMVCGMAYFWKFQRGDWKRVAI